MFENFPNGDADDRPDSPGDGHYQPNVPSHDSMGGMHFLPQGQPNAPKEVEHPATPPVEELTDFIVPHDGLQQPVDSTEQQAARTQFESAVTDIVLTHIVDMHRIPGVEGVEDPSSHVLLRAPISNTEYYDVGVRSYTDVGTFTGDFPPYLQPVRRVSVTRKTDGIPTALCLWTEGTDGVVRRRDIYGITEVSPGERDFIEIERDVFGAGGENIPEAEMTPVDPISSFELEMQMGMAMPPVGMREIQGLTRLLGRCVERPAE